MAGVVAELGGSWDQWERELDLDRIKALQEHYREQPTVQAMVQAYLGVEPGAGAPVDQSDEEIEQELNQLVQLGLAL